MFGMALADSACGNSPPFFVRPRMTYWDYITPGGSNDNSESANKSALITRDYFVSYMEYYIKQIRAGKTNLR